MEGAILSGFLEKMKAERPSNVEKSSPLDRPDDTDRSGMFRWIQDVVERVLPERDSGKKDPQNPNGPPPV